MKRRRVQRVERRRPQVDLNLAGYESKSGPAATSKGLLARLKRLLGLR
jgi:hypothetical protein